MAKTSKANATTTSPVEQDVAGMAGSVQCALPVKKETPLMSNKAFSIVSEGDKKYSVVCIHFNMSGDTSFSVLEDGLDLYGATDLFKTSVINAGLFEI